jgi:hypothetical protein
MNISCSARDFSRFHIAVFVQVKVGISAALFRFLATFDRPSLLHGAT